MPSQPQSQVGLTWMIPLASGRLPQVCGKARLMIICDRLRDLRESKHLSQGEIEKRTGLLRCYISRVENGHTVPSIETLEKMARALEIPMYQLFYDGDEPKQLPAISLADRPIAWGESGQSSRYLDRLKKALAKMGDADRSLVMYMAQKVSRRRR